MSTMREGIVRAPSGYVAVENSGYTNWSFVVSALADERRGKREGNCEKTRDSCSSSYWIHEVAILLTGLSSANVPLDFSEPDERLGLANATAAKTDARGR